MIYLGADHRGYKAKEKLKKSLISQGFQVTDMGTNSEEPVDYPLVATEVCLKVVQDPNNRGVLLCGSGVGVCIAANKIKGIKAGQAWTEEIAHKARNDDNINVLCLPADTLGYRYIKKINLSFLNTSFGSEDRYKKRLQQIEDLEQ